jgi:hypothetical protein
MMMRGRKNETNWHRGNVDGNWLAAETLPKPGMKGGGGECLAFG